MRVTGTIQPHKCPDIPDELYCSSAQYMSGFCTKKNCLYLSKHKILHNDQYGFPKNRQFTDVLLNQSQHFIDNAH